MYIWYPWHTSAAKETKIRQVLLDAVRRGKTKEKWREKKSLSQHKKQSNSSSSVNQHKGQNDNRRQSTTISTSNYV